MAKSGIIEHGVAMDCLLTCRCGHRLDNHHADGCWGDRFTNCDCSRNRDVALETALERFRREAQIDFEKWRPTPLIKDVAS